MQRRGDGSRAHRSPSELVSELIAAVSDARIEDLLALVDPKVVCIPATRPGLTVYNGHAGMAKLVADLKAAYGPHRIEIEDITEESGARVTARTRVVQESSQGARILQRVTSVYTLSSGLVTSIEGESGTDPS
jgi:hypothetical protein